MEGAAQQTPKRTFVGLLIPVPRIRLSCCRGLSRRFSQLSSQLAPRLARQGSRQNWTTALALTVRSPDVRLAVTVGAVPALLVSIAEATPSVPVTVPLVTKPSDVVNVTVTPLMGYSPESRTVATMEAVGGSPVLTRVVVSVMRAGTPVAEEEESGLSEQPAINTAASMMPQRRSMRAAFDRISGARACERGFGGSPPVMQQRRSEVCR